MARAREKGPVFWRWAIAGMLALVLALFALVAFNRPPALDPLTACRADHRDPAHTILLIDQSDPFNTNDLGWVEEFMDAEARLLPKYGRLTVMTPNADSPYEPVEIYTYCSPGSVEDANPLTQNPRMIEDAWREDFYAPLKTRVEQVLTDKSQTASPLVEAIYTIADRPDFQKGGNNRRLLIVSDLMQHSQGFSFYRNGADFDAFVESPLAAELPDMAGIVIVARIVPRQDYDLPLADVKYFWGQYFAKTDGDYSTVN